MKKQGFLLIFFIVLQSFLFAEKSDSISVYDSLTPVLSSAPSENFFPEASSDITQQQSCAPKSDFISDSLLPVISGQESIIKNAVPDNVKKRKKLIAALLAFPLPFGIIGLHRIYLGTKPYVPLVYIASLGGGLGIIPFIDFIVICLEKDITRYCNNSSIIMWAK